MKYETPQDRMADSIATFFNLATIVLFIGSIAHVVDTIIKAI